MAYAITDRWNVNAIPSICAFMRIPELYWAVSDRLDPQPEERDLETWIRHPDVATFVATWDKMIIGYVQFVKRTSICAEMTVAFAKHWRGMPAKALTQYSMAELFRERGILKIYGGIPSDNKGAILAARHIGMIQEGRLTRAMVREDGVRDLLIFGITKEEFLKRGAN